MKGGNKDYKDVIAGVGAEYNQYKDSQDINNITGANYKPQPPTRIGNRVILNVNKNRADFWNGYIDHKK